MNPQNDRLVPLALIALELEIDANALVEQFGDDVILDGAGLRCVPTDRCREYIAGINATRQADQERMRRQIAECAAGIDRINAPIFAKVAAIQAQQELYAGTDMPTLAMMLAGDGDNRLARAGRNKDEMLAGDLHFHRLTDDQEAQQ